MAVQLLASVIYESIRHSWLVATVLLKYVLASYIAVLAYRDSLDLQGFLEIVEEYSRETVAGIVLIGIISLIAGFRPEPLSKLFSQVVAVAYFGYLFWEY